MLQRHTFSAILLAHGIIFIFLSWLNLPLGHDTMINFQVFRTIYSDLLTYGEFPFWLPFTTQGLVADYSYIFTFTPSLYFIVAIGKTLEIENVLILFKFAMYLEEVLFILGMYLTTEKYYRNKYAVLCTCTIAFLSLHWNFHLFYLLPLTIHFTIQFMKGEGLENVAFAFLVYLLGGFFYTQIFISVVLLLLIFTYLIINRSRHINYTRFNIKPWLIALLITICLVYFTINIEFALNAMESTRSYTSKRLPDGRVPYDVFISYGGFTSSAKFYELLYGAPVRFAFLSYSGLIAMAFSIYAILRVKKSDFYAIFFALIFVLLFSVGESGVIAKFIYQYYPMMDRFRHIGFVTPVAKIFIIVCAGFGIDHYLSSKNNKNYLTLIFIAISLGIFFIAHDYSAGWSYPYLVSTDLAIPFYMHYMHWVILLAAILFSRFKPLINPKAYGAFLLLCVVIEMGTYRANIELNSPAASEKYYNDWKMISNEFLANKYKFQDHRMFFSDLQNIPQIAAHAMNYWGTKNSLAYGSIPIDLCFPEHRTDLNPLPFDLLIRTRFGFQEDELLDGFFALADITKDKVFFKAIGCYSNKLYLTTTPFITSDTTIAKNYVHSSQDLYGSPVILVSPSSTQPTVKYSADSLLSNKSIITVRRFSSNYLSTDVDINIPGGAYLVYLDNTHQGWKATVNGEPTEILNTNLAFKSVFLKEGPNHVIFEFTGSRLARFYIWLNFLIGILSSLFFILFCAWIVAQPFRVAKIPNSETS